MIELYLSSDGKHTVHAAADTPEKLEALVPRARLLYEQVLGSYGTKAQMWQEAHGATANGQTKTNGRQETVAEVREPGAPVCPKHLKRMIFRRGRFGAFWSCPSRTPDGRWCDYTVDVSTEEHGQAAKKA